MTADDEPVSYLTLAKGAPVRASDGADIGVVAHVLADPDADIFDGLIIDVRRGPGGHRFVDASQVAEMDDGGVTLTLDGGAAERLPEPAANPASLAAGPDDIVPPDLGDKLRRAWDLISGKG
ncbi:MAG TPA: PRC-barrel domain-containing protein [Baekduia sp.]